MILKKNTYFVQFCFVFFDSKFKSNLLFILISLIALILNTNANAQKLFNKTNRDTVDNPFDYMVLPILSYNPETSLRYGVISTLVVNNTSSDKYVRPSSIAMAVMHTLKKQLFLQAKSEIFFKNGINFFIRTKYLYYPTEFYGIGNNTQQSDTETYTSRHFIFQGQLTRNLNNSHLFPGITIDVLHNKPLEDLAPAGKLQSGKYNGVEGAFLIGFGPYFRFDTRDNIFFPGKGKYLETKFLYYPDALGNDYTYTSLFIDARRYFSIVNRKNIIAFQASGHFNSNQAQPFYKLNSIGRHDKLRGILEERYIDKKAVYLQAEYRRFLFWRFSGTAFIGTGKVSEQLSSINFIDLKAVFGGGIRYKVFRNNDLHIRSDIGICTNKKIAFYIQIGEAF